MKVPPKSPKVPKANYDQVFYVPTDGPHKGKRCPAIVTEVLGPDLVNLEVRTEKGHFVENAARVPIVPDKPKPGQACRK